MISAKFFLCIALFVLAAQCNAADEQSVEVKSKTLLQKFQAWIANKLKQFKQKVLDAIQKLKDFKNSLMTKSLTHIHEPIAAVEVDLASWKSNFPEKCITAAQTQLTEVRRASAKEFFTCANLTNAVVDAGKIFVEGTSVILRLTQLCTNIAKAVFKCKPLFTPTGFKCAKEYVINIIQELKEDFPVMKQYFLNMVTIGKDMKAQIQSCLYPQKSKVDYDLNVLITNLNKCVA